MTTNTLTEAEVRKIPYPDEGAKTYSFGGRLVEGKPAPAGFAIQVSCGGAKSWTLSYRQGGRQKRETLGRWPGLNVVKATRRARKLKTALDDGKVLTKPGMAAVALAEGQGGPLMADVLDAFLKGHVATLKASTAGEARRIIEKDIRPSLGAMAIGRIGTPQMNVMREAIRARAKGRKRGGARTEELTLDVLRKCFDWFKNSSTDPYAATFVNPMPRGWGRAKKDERRKRRGKRILCKGQGQANDDDLQTLWLALMNPEEGRKGTRNASGERLAPKYPAFLRMCLWTAGRRSEVGGMHERELVAKGDDWQWVIPGARMKGAVEHIVPLSRQAVRELKALKVTPGGKKFVFTADGKKPFSDFSGNMTALRKRIAATCQELERPAMASFGPHDLRRTSRTLMRRLGVSHDIGELAIAHVREELIDTYVQHDELPAIRDAFQKVGDELDRIMCW